MASRVKTKFKQNTTASHGVQIAKVPSSFDWLGFAENANYFCGLGSQLVPLTSFVSGNWEYNGGDPYFQTYTYEMKLFPKRNPTTRRWEFYRPVINVAVDSTFPIASALAHPKMTVTGVASIPATGGGFKFLQDNELKNQIQFVSGTEATFGITGETYALTMSFSGADTKDTGNPVHISHLSYFGCWEDSRRTIDPTNPIETDIGVHDVIDPSMPIRDYDESPKIFGVPGVYNATNEAIREARKSGLYYYIRPITNNGTLLTDVSGVLLMDNRVRWFADFGSGNGLGIPVQSRKINSAITGTIQIYVLSRGTKGEKFHLNFTSSWGNGAEIHTNQMVISYALTDVPQWDNVSLNVGADTFSGSMIPSLGTSVIRFNRIRNDGSNPAYLYSICIVEPDVSAFTDY